MPRARPTYLSPEDRIALRDRYLAGESRAALLADFRISERTYYGILRSLGIRGHQKPTGEWTNGYNPKLTPEDRAEIRRRYANGETRKELAAAFRVSETTITNNTRGVQRLRGFQPKQRRDGLSFEKRAEIAEKYRQGATLSQLAREYGVSRGCITYHLRGTERPRGEDLVTVRRWTAEAAKLRETWLTAPDAARSLNLDKSHLCALLREGRFPGAFQLGDYKHAPWLIPRESVEAYRKRKE